MDSKYDFKRDWEKTKKNLKKFSEEALRVAKEGEKELLRLSKKSKLHIDATAIDLKKDRLYFLIGREYTKLRNPKEQSAELKKLLAEFSALNREEKTVKKKFQHV